MTLYGEYDNIDTVPQKRGRVKMKKLPSVKAIMAITTILLVNICTLKTLDGTKSRDNNTIIPTNTLVSSISNNRLLSSNNANEILAINEYANKASESTTTLEETEEIVYDGMTIDALANKLDKNLKSTLKGYGMVFAESSIKYGVDPYLALAIVLHETGCASGTCSTLVKSCNNVGGMKGAGSCGGSSYARFKTLESGIDAFFKNLSNNYYKKGLKTPESIGKKYAESKTWATNIRYYMKKIKNS